MAEKKSDNNLIIISVDALNSKDFEYIKTLPNFKSFIEEGSYVREVQSVYPSLTYTCHSSIITGTYPDKHGIYANEIKNTNNPTNQPWYWYEKYIKVPTLFDYAKQASLTTANVLWPVMAGGPINYNCPEIWSVTKEGWFSLFMKNGTKSLFPLILKRALKLKGKEEPYLDNFIESVSSDIIIKKKPNLLTIHLIELDHVRHVIGLSDPITKTVLKRMDKRIGNIIDATKKAGTYDTTTFVILGDHGCTDFENVVYLNTLLKETGLLEVDEKNNIVSWKVYANACGGSVHIHIHESATKEDRQKIDDEIGKLMVMPNSFLKHHYSKKEVNERYHLDGDFAFVLEAKEGYIFKNAISDRLVKHRAAIPNCYIAEHGQVPTHENLKTLFLAKGPKIKKGVSVESACLVDEGPTLARILDLEMEKVDGCVIEEIFK